MGDVPRPPVPDIIIQIFGGDWPEGSETRMRELADIWDTAARNFGDARDDAATARDKLLDTIEASSKPAMRAALDEIIEHPEGIPAQVTVSEEIAELAREYAGQLEITKWAINLAMVEAAVSLALMLAGPGGVAIAAAKSAAKRLALRTMIKQAAIRVAQRGAQAAGRSIARSPSVRSITRTMAVEVATQSAMNAGIETTAQAIANLDGDSGFHADRIFNSAVSGGAFGVGSGVTRGVAGNGFRSSLAQGAFGAVTSGVSQGGGNNAQDLAFSALEQAAGGGHNANAHSNVNSNAQGSASSPAGDAPRGRTPNSLVPNRPSPTPDSADAGNSAATPTQSSPSSNLAAESPRAVDTATTPGAHEGPVAASAETPQAPTAGDSTTSTNPDSTSLNLPPATSTSPTGEMSAGAGTTSAADGQAIGAEQSRDAATTDTGTPASTEATGSGDTAAHPTDSAADAGDSAAHPADTSGAQSPTSDTTSERAASATSPSDSSTVSDSTAHDSTAPESSDTAQNNESRPSTKDAPLTESTSPASDATTAPAESHPADPYFGDDVSFREPTAPSSVTDTAAPDYSDTTTQQDSYYSQSPTESGGPADYAADSRGPLSADHAPAADSFGAPDWGMQTGGISESTSSGNGDATTGATPNMNEAEGGATVGNAATAEGTVYTSAGEGTTPGGYASSGSNTSTMSAGAAGATVNAAPSHSLSEGSSTTGSTGAAGPVAQMNPVAHSAAGAAGSPTPSGPAPAASPTSPASPASGGPSGTAGANAANPASPANPAAAAPAAPKPAVSSAPSGVPAGSPNAAAQSTAASGASSTPTSGAGAPATSAPKAGGAVPNAATSRQDPATHATPPSPDTNVESDSDLVVTASGVAEGAGAGAAGAAAHHAGTHGSTLHRDGRAAIDPEIPRCAASSIEALRQRYDGAMFADLSAKDVVPAGDVHRAIRATPKIYKNPTGDPDATFDTWLDIENHLEAQGLGDGSAALLTIGWHANPDLNGHTNLAFNDNGHITFVDAATGETHPWPPAYTEVGNVAVSYLTADGTPEHPIDPSTEGLLKAASDSVGDVDANKPPIKYGEWEASSVDEIPPQMLEQLSSNLNENSGLSLPDDAIVKQRIGTLPNGEHIHEVRLDHEFSAEHSSSKYFDRSPDPRDGEVVKISAVSISPPFTGDSPPSNSMFNNVGVWETHGDRTVFAEADIYRSYRGIGRTSSELAAQKAVHQNPAVYDTLPTDQAGHILGHQFFPTQGTPNFFAQDGKFNTGQYNGMETEIADWSNATQGKGVHVHFEVSFDHAPGQKRPDKVFTAIEPRDIHDEPIVAQRRFTFTNDSTNSFTFMKMKAIAAAIEQYFQKQ